MSTTTMTDRATVTGARPAPRLLRLAGVGILAGLTWGVAARAWMRTVSEEPEFSWEGTLLILVFTALSGLCLALIEGLRRRGVGVLRLALVLPALVMFMGQGLPMLPGALLLGLALADRLARPWAVAAAWAAQVSTVFLTYDQLAPLTPYPAIVQIGGYLVLVLALGVGWRTVFMRRA